MAGRGEDCSSGGRWSRRLRSSAKALEASEDEAERAATAAKTVAADQWQKGGGDFESGLGSSWQADKGGVAKRRR